MTMLLCFGLIKVFMTQAVASDSLVLASPGARLQAVIKTENGGLTYRLLAGTKVLIASSGMGLRVNETEIGTEAASLSLVKKEEVREVNHTRLNATQSLDHHYAYRILVQEKAIAYTIEFRLYDNGCAFRYYVNASPSHHVKAEKTVFTLPATADAWYFERTSHWKLKSYAGLWQKTTVQNLPTVSPGGPIQGKPIVAVLPGDNYLVVTEAALYNYSGMRLEALGEGRLGVNFTEGANGFQVKGPLISPWRVILYAEGLHELVNNHVIEHLNPAPDQKLFKNTKYIRPGKAAWSWITRNENYLEPAEERKMIDAAAALNFQYTLVDEGWEKKWSDKWVELRNLCNYAARKNMSVWVWKHSAELRNNTYRDNFLDSLREAGVVGIKTDFMNSEAKELIDFEIGLLEAAAKRSLMVNFHGCHAPTGESKTWPNELTREGIRGMELNGMNEPIPAWHNAALPFTRFLTGHGDYTPGFFSNRGTTTIAHQLALFYLFNSPFQCMAENPAALLAKPHFRPVNDLLKVLPVTWDETVVLPGSAIGELAAFARRKGEDWYVAVINGQEKEIDFDLSFSFLKKKGPVKLAVISDADTEAGLDFRELVIHPGEKRTYRLAPNGGLVLQVKRR